MLFNGQSYRCDFIPACGPLAACPSGWLLAVAFVLHVAMGGAGIQRTLCAQEPFGPQMHATMPVHAAAHVPLVNPQGACQPCMHGVDCTDGGCAGEASWDRWRAIDFGPMGPGEYAGPARGAPVNQYRLRAGDELRFVYVLTRKLMDAPYRLMVGDSVLIDSLEEDLRVTNGNNIFTVQPDGTISVRLLGEVQAAGRTVEQLREILEKRYTEFYKEPKIDVIPQKTNTRLNDLRDAVGGQSGLNPPVFPNTVMPDGTVRLPGLGSVWIQGLTLDELKTEINLRYRELVSGLEVEPFLVQQAPHFIYVLGEVNQAGRFQLQTPTTALGAIALAGGHRVGGNLRQIVVIRRTEDWRLMATMLDLRGAILGKTPVPSDEIWLRDGDVVIIPPAPIQVFDNFVRKVFSEGVYGIVPFGGISISLGNNNNN